MRIVRTANDGRDYPDEEFLSLPSMTKAGAQKIADAINEALSGDDPCFYPEYWKVVPDDYRLAEPFQP